MPRARGKRLNRRVFLGASAAAAGLAALQACAPAAAPTATPAAAKPAAAPAAPAPAAPTAAAAAPAPATKARSGPVQVFTMVDKVWADVGMLDATLRYNEDHRNEVQVTLEETAQGWDTKVLAQIKDKNLRWSGHGYAAFFDSFKYIRAGLVQPLDDYLKASKNPWGQKQKDLYFNQRIYDALQFEGKQYFIPMKANIHMVGWRQDYVEAAGYETMPKTWDEVEKMIVKMKPALEKDQVTPVAIQRDIFRCIGTMFTTFIEKPFDEEGILKFESPEWINLIEMLKKWQDQGLARLDATGVSVDVWQKGKVAMSLGSHSWVRIGRQVWGTAKVKGGMPPKANASAPDRTWIHIDSGFVFPNSPHPQEATDWLLTVLGPEGAAAERWWKGTATFSGSPVHAGMVDKVLKDNAAYTEVYDLMSTVPNSQIITLPVAGAYAITEAKMWPWLDRFFKGEINAKEAMANTRKEVTEEVNKQLKKN
jgi:ABC-type glycerol-3-phosphate transport system substrate-binding protein